ncbi:hypothetical protein FB451DRAFT_581130 [Mycena latifolia]|nr:hypothetical protein FB451DRAFT_581130 [Mycena latifolia]
MGPIIESIIHSNEPLSDSQSLEVRSTLEATLAVLSGLEEQISKTVVSLLKLESERRRCSEYAVSLKGALSPIRHIPSEILAEVFLRCRDESLMGDNKYSVTNPRQAPMLLGHISSRWRRVCYDSPRLWDHCYRPATSMLSFGLLQTLLNRSGILPLRVELEMRTHIWPTENADDNALDLVFHHHHRLQHIRFDIWAAAPLSPLPFSNRRTALPILSSLEIEAHTDLDTTGLLSLFNDAPQLRAVSLAVYYASTHSLGPALPWAQLTRLELHIHISLDEARDILLQCEEIEECQLSRMVRCHELGPSQRTRQLDHLQRFTIDTDGEHIPSTFFDAFTFPNLLYLNISADYLPTLHVLTSLYQRSKFRLKHLELHLYDQGTYTNDLIHFLCHLRYLQTLDLAYCPVDDALFEAFTYDPHYPDLSLSLRHLESVTIGSANMVLTGVAVEMVESVCAYTGGRNIAFPALESVHLRADHGHAWCDGEIEARFKVACATGFINR